ncbi:MAG: hypothetical protein HY657_01410 [Acidobacteria bacterium]|nr:hypothetical protein [Acidobacteriota bacterium]
MAAHTALKNLLLKGGRRLAGRTRWASKVTWEAVKDAFHVVRGWILGARDVSVNAGKDVFRRARRPVRRVQRRRRQLEEQWQHYRTEWAIERELEDVALRDRTLVVGPWFSEVGFETLYWIPFLQWAKLAFRLDPERVVAVSRGGVAAWYQEIAARYIDIWDGMEPAEFAARNAARPVTKQYEPSALDRDILDHVARRLGTRDFDVIHPSLMYRLFTLYWTGQRAMGFVDTHTRFTRQSVVPTVDPALLPREYVAVKLYAARSLPDTPDVRARLRTLVTSLAERLPVVLLDTGLVLQDDHEDYAFASQDVISAKRWMTPQNNLGAQTQIVAGAQAFVGTCGSIAWLAPRLGVDTSALFVDPSWLHAHLAVAMRAYHKLEAGRFAAADLRALDPLQVGHLVARAHTSQGLHP